MATNVADFEQFHHDVRNNDEDRSESEEPYPTSNNLCTLIQHLPKRDALLERLVDKMTTFITDEETTSKWKKMVVQKFTDIHNRRRNHIQMEEDGRYEYKRDERLASYFHEKVN
ncbi:hypothetical protein QE152_g5459 [Popillia japonica]|uniref:Uncharacterized protein n=1 Tax=Popillia japonica TaxID=7064 RepID=A0AAW1MP39_POPJA